MANSQSSTIDMKRVPLTVAILALLALPFAFVQAKSGILETNPTLVFLFAVALLASVGTIAYFATFRHLPSEIRRSPYLIFFAIFAFAAMMDLLIGLTLLGYTDVMRAYFETGEPYLDSNHGMSVNLWDGTAHFALYIAMCYCIAASLNHYRIALFWVGSMIVSCIVYMVGNLIGEYAEHIEPSYLLNLPFMIVPVFYAWKIAAATNFDLSRSSGGGIQRSVLTLALVLVSAISAYRMLVVLNPEISATQFWGSQVEPYLLSPARYPQIQMLAFGLYLMPFALLGALALWRPPSKAIALWAWIVAGAVAQGQFSHLVASLASASDPQFAIAASQRALFWISNITVMIVPLWFAWYYCRDLELLE